MRPACALLLVAAGCAPSPSDWFPAQVGDVMTYRLDRGSGVEVLEWRAVREVAVGGARGVEIESPVGASRLAWRDGVLVASELAGTTFEPPIPVALVGEATWEGSVASGPGSLPAAATIVGKRGKEADKERGVPVLEVSLELRCGGTVRTVESTFGLGVGLLAERQRTGGRLDSSLALLGRG
jgi:hypothetical protein